MPADLAFGWESCEAVFADPRFRDLIGEQWTELSHLPDEPLDLDFPRAFQMERAGAYRLWIARRNDRMVGFIQWQIICPLGYRNTKWAIDAGWYFEAAERDIFAALGMWRGAVDALKTEGVGVVRGHDNHKRPLGVFFKRLGMAAISTVYQKGL